MMEGTKELRHQRRKSKITKVLAQQKAGTHPHHPHPRLETKRGGGAARIQELSSIPQKCEP